MIETMRSEAIRKIVSDRKIEFLTHFTQVSNLRSILNFGLRSIADLRADGIHVEVNDHHRHDRCRDSVCLSISHPNCQMFYRYRCNFSDAKWCVLGLKPEILWEKDCAFCKHNAADARVSNVPLEQRRLPASLSALFDEIDGCPTRAQQCLSHSDPTDVQAEVLVFKKIEPKFVIGAQFDCQETKDHFEPLFGPGKRALLTSPGKSLFAQRSYVRK